MLAPAISANEFTESPSPALRRELNEQPFTAKGSGA